MNLQLKNDSIPNWLAFAAVAKHGGFSAASRALRVPLTQISKRVGKLEDALGLRLFQRTTRSVRLTVEGKTLLPKVESILNDLSDVENYFTNPDELSGPIRVTCVPFVAHKLLLPAIQRFHLDHPKVHVDLHLSESFVNLIEDGFDMAVRIETPKDSQYVYRKIAPNQLILCASKSYLKSCKKPLSKPNDLARHNLLMLSIHKNCRFKKSQVRMGDFESAKVITCEDGIFLTQAAREGLGVLLRSRVDVKDLIDSGELVQVLSGYPIERFGFIYAVVPTRRYLAPRVRELMSFIDHYANPWKRDGVTKKEQSEPWVFNAEWLGRFSPIPDDR